jgi:signal transduction histidine kinase
MDLDIDPDLYARIDAEAIETVLRNLLENALLYSAGPPSIQVILKREGHRAHLIFSDKGKGIERKEQKKIFQMFYRVRPSDETIRGSGVGLFIVRAVVRLHHGKVWAESEGKGKGTTFHILLPLTRETAGKQTS